MGFSLSGLVGAGAQDALSRQVAEQLRQAMFEEEQRQAKARESIASAEQQSREQERLDRAKLAQEMRAQQAEALAQQAQAQQQEIQRRVGLSNIRSNIDLMGQMPGVTPEDRAKYAQEAFIRSGDEGIGDIAAMLKPAAPKMRAVTTRGPNNAPINRMVPETEAVEEWRAPEKPASPAAPDVQWVVLQDGTITEVPKGQAPPGSKPYSASSGGLAAQSAATRNKRVATALNAIEKLKELAPNRSPGLPGIVEGVGQTMAGYAGYNTKVRQYKALIQPTAMQMAVAIQGAANLSDSERQVMAGALGQIETMDYESQMALLDNAAQLLAGSGDVQKMTVRDARGQMREMWVPIATGPNVVQMGQPAPATAPNTGMDAILQKYGAKIVPE